MSGRVENPQLSEASLAFSIRIAEISQRHSEEQKLAAREMVDVFREMASGLIDRSPLTLGVTRNISALATLTYDIGTQKIMEQRWYTDGEGKSHQLGHTDFTPDITPNLFINQSETITNAIEERMNREKLKQRLGQTTQDH